MAALSIRAAEYRQTARDIVGIFFVKKHVFLLTLVGVIAGALMLSLLTPPIYETSAQLVVKPQNSKPLIFDQDTSRLNTYSEVTEQTLNTIIFLLTSDDVLRDVVLTHQLASADDSDAVQNEISSLRGRVKAEPLTMSSVVKVTMRGGNPEKITAQLQTLLDAYIRFHIRVNQATEGRLKFFTEQTDHFRNSYARINQQLVDRSRSLNIIDPIVQRDTNLALVKDMELLKTQIVAQTETLRAKMEAFKAALVKFKTDDRLAGLPSETIINYPALVEMEKSLAQLVINRQRAFSDFQPNSKQARDADSQYQNMRAQIRRHTEQIVADLDAQIASLKQSMTEIDSRIEEITKRGIALAGDALELDRIMLEHKLTKDNYILYSNKQEEARINEEKDRWQFANVSIATRPAVPGSPWFPQKSKIMLLAVPLALMLALAFSAMSYALEQRLWTPTDVALHTDLRVLGSLDAMGIVQRQLFSLRSGQLAAEVST
jgi:uncharacterized protein involved in exopolysaccharide biosynthesis